MARRTRPEIVRVPLFGCLLLALAGCMATGPTESTPARSAGADPGLADRITLLESRIIGLTDELDRLGNRVVALERGGATVEPDAEWPETKPPPAREEPESPAPEESAPAEPPAPEDPSPTDTPPAEPEKDLDDWPTPAAEGKRPTSLLVDARELPEGALPSTIHKQWRILDPAGEVLLTQEDIDADVLAARPIFWVAERGRELGPAALPLLGARPLELTVDAAVVAHGEAILSLDAASAEALRKVKDYTKLAKAGRLAILLRKP